MQQLEWIKVEERLPALPPKACGGHVVRLYIQNGDLRLNRDGVFTYFATFEFKGRDVTRYVTHWMPIPDPPNARLSITDTLMKHLLMPLLTWIKQLRCKHEYVFDYWIPEEHLTVEHCKHCKRKAMFELLPGFTKGRELK